MKKTLLILILATTTLFAHAQLVTISGANQIPQIGQEILYSNVNSFGFNLFGVPDGTSTIWDFSSLTVTDNVTFTYTDASLEADAADFPEATIAEAISGVDGLMYFKTDNYFMARKGATGGLYLNYDLDSALLLSFPITAGESVDNNYTGIMSTSVLEMILENGDVHMEADAQGTITLPNGTVLTDVLRVHVEENFRGMYDLGTGLTEIMSIDDDFYYWFHEDYTNPIFVYGITTVSSMSSPDEETEALRFQPIIASEAPVTNTVSNLVYPNPSTGIINITNSSDYNTVTVLDIQGKVVKNVKSASQIDLNSLSNGTYFIKLNGDMNSDLHKILIEK